MQNHLRRHLPTSLELSNLLQPTLLNYSTSTNPTQPTPFTYSTTQLHPVSVPSQAFPHAIRSRDQCQDNGRRPHRSVGSTRRISPPEGWRMEPRTQIHLEIEESWKKKYFARPLDWGEALAWHSATQGSALRYSRLRMMGFLDAMNKPVW